MREEKHRIGMFSNIKVLAATANIGTNIKIG